MIGGGVVGLQAIATAKRLGGVDQGGGHPETARAEAESLGAKIVGFEIPPEIALGTDGYAQALPAEWLEKESEASSPSWPRPTW